MLGIASRGNWMSITAPMHWTILPSFAWVVVVAMVLGSWSNAL
jgi:hypothetical protein